MTGGLKKSHLSVCGVASSQSDSFLKNTKPEARRDERETGAKGA